ncbi:hypothetical protein BDR06DRAFT_1002792 [Suillus hirtellus]|nr:hypothetical protein BDR06DRAFT_1002792 [Suillus hirtellus]
MTLVSNDPNWWPLLDFYRIYSCFIVASSTVVIYDWVLTFGQEFELVLRQRWSRMTVTYISVRYFGMLSFGYYHQHTTGSSVSFGDRYSEDSALFSISSFNSLSSYVGYSELVIDLDLPGTILGLTQWWMIFIVNVMLGYILITRLRAMYKRSRKISIFLVGISLACMIVSGVILAISSSNVSGEELILSGTYQCVLSGNSGSPLSKTWITWILGIVWEFLVLCLAVWIAIKHFRELQRPSPGSDCFVMLIKTHVFYFAAHAAVSCLAIGSLLSPQISGSSSIGTEVYSGIVEISLLAQMFVMGPRLLLSIREYNANLVADSETGTNLTTIVFQEGIPVSTGDDV